MKLFLFLASIISFIYGAASLHFGGAAFVISGAVLFGSAAVVEAVNRLEPPKARGKSIAAIDSDPTLKP